MRSACHLRDSPSPREPHGAGERRGREAEPVRTSEVDLCGSAGREVVGQQQIRIAAQLSCGVASTSESVPSTGMRVVSACRMTRSADLAERRKR